MDLHIGLNVCMYLDTINLKRARVLYSVHQSAFENNVLKTHPLADNLFTCVKSVDVLWSTLMTQWREPNNENTQVLSHH